MSRQLSLVAACVFALSVPAKAEDPIARPEVGRVELFSPSVLVSGSTSCEFPVIVCPPPQTVRRLVPRTTYQTVTKTIMVPTTVLETRQTQAVEYRDEVRERTVTVYDQVPETRTVTTEHTVLVPTIRHRTETYTVRVPVETSVPETYTVNRTSVETRTGQRIIERCVPGTELRTVCLSGKLVKQGVPSTKGGVRVQARVEDSGLTQQAVPVMRRQLVRQTYEYDVRVVRPETHTRMVKQISYRDEIKTRIVPETVSVPKTELRTHEVTEMRSVPRPKTESYVERVPHVVTREIQVPVTKMIARQVCEQVPVTTYELVDVPVSMCVPCLD
jgi:hypothetical protein